MNNGRPVELSIENEVCNAILVAWFGGEAGAKAIAEALTGKNSPAGRLPVSMPRSTGAVPCYYSMLPGSYDHAYIEGKKDALFEFGFGLSYTEFEYGDLTVTKQEGYDVTVTCTVKNIGGTDGDEVVQLYVEDVDSSVVTPRKLLKGFERISLKTGESRMVTFKLDFDSFKLMDSGYRWVVEPGRFSIMVGASSRDIRLTGEVVF